MLWENSGKKQPLPHWALTGPSLGVPSLGPHWALAGRSLTGPSLSAQALQELELSLNPLRDRGPRALARLLPLCPALRRLGLRGCGLRRPFPVPEGTPLRSLALSYNALGAAGLRQLLRALPARGLRSLELASVLGRRGDGGGDGVGTELARYLQQADCALCHLSLAGNHLRDQDIEELARSLPHCPSLVSLELSGNPGLGSETFRNILEALEKRERGLELLNLTGCGIRDLDGDALSRSRGKIRDLRLPGRKFLKGP
ncbi:tonsoku-like protein [Cinclus cinclus]|uniref:tonsoku-like protein n=1 Tax=Cinclus cinclus TaxID=127875 RepID=UPI002E0D5490